MKYEICLSVCISVFLSLRFCVFVFLIFLMSVCPFFCISAFLSVLSVCIRISLSRSVYLSPSLYLRLFIMFTHDECLEGVDGVDAVGEGDEGPEKLRHWAAVQDLNTQKLDDEISLEEEFCCARDGLTEHFYHWHSCL